MVSWAHDANGGHEANEAWRETVLQFVFALRAFGLGPVLWITDWGSAPSGTGSLSAIQHGLYRRGSPASPRFKASEDRQDRP